MKKCAIYKCRFFGFLIRCVVKHESSADGWCELMTCLCWRIVFFTRHVCQAVWQTDTISMTHNEPADYHTEYSSFKEGFNGAEVCGSISDGNICHINVLCCSGFWVFTVGSGGQTWIVFHTLLICLYECFILGTSASCAGKIRKKRPIKRA